MNVAIPGYKLGRKPPILLAAVAAAALGIAAVVGVWQFAAAGGVWQFADSGISAHRTNYDFARNDTRSLTLYLVDSQEQEDMILAGEQAAASERANYGIPAANETVLIMRASNLNEQVNVSAVLEAWSTAPGGVRIVDLREERLGPISNMPLASELEAMPSSEALGESFSPCTAPGVDDYDRLTLVIFGAC